MKINFLLLLGGMWSSLSVANQIYVPPPTSSTSSHVPAISDQAMERCVKIYNESEWLLDELNKMEVDQYSEQSVNNYNRMVNEYRSMIDEFNTNCAGKQSYSACKAAQKLNEEQGLPNQDC